MKLFTTKQAAVVLGLSNSRIRQAARDCRLHSYGGRYLLSEYDLKLIASRKGKHDRGLWFAIAHRYMTEAIEESNYVELKKGKFLASSELLESEQDTWDEYDESKEVDFSAAAYWVTSNNGINPIAISTAADLIAILIDQEVL